MTRFRQWDPSMGMSEEEYKNEIREINNETYKPRGGDRDAERYALLTGKDISTVRDRYDDRYELLTGKGRDMGATTSLNVGGERPSDSRPYEYDDTPSKMGPTKYEERLYNQPEESRESSRPSAEDFVREYTKGDSEWRTDYKELDNKYDKYRGMPDEYEKAKLEKLKREFGKDIEYGSDYWKDLGWKQGTDRETSSNASMAAEAYPGPAEEEITITPSFDSGVTDTGTVDGPLSESGNNQDSGYSISNRVDDYIDALGLTGKDAEETRANTLAVTDSTTAAAIARQQERTITEKTDDWLQKQYTAAGLGQVDEEGGQYWKDDIARGQTRTQVRDNIKRVAAKKQSNPAPSSSPTVTITPSASEKADDWLQDYYTSAGLGKVDAAGREYWKKDLAGGQTKAQIKSNIMAHKK